MTKLGCAFTSCGASTSSISCGRRGCCAEAVPKVINIKPQPKMAANQKNLIFEFEYIMDPLLLGNRADQPKRFRLSLTPLDASTGQPSPRVSNPAVQSERVWVACV